MTDKIIYGFSDEKNAFLKKHRSVSFDEIIFLIENGQVLDVIDNNIKYRHQFVYVIEVKGYVYAVPSVKNGNEVFLKTAYPSRVLTKRYLEKE